MLRGPYVCKGVRIVDCAVCKKSCVKGDTIFVLSCWYVPPASIHAQCINRDLASKSKAIDADSFCLYCSEKYNARRFKACPNCGTDNIEQYVIGKITGQIKRVRLSRDDNA